MISSFIKECVIGKSLGHKLVLSICLLALSCPTIALKGDEGKPIQIDADHGTVNQKAMTSEFSGNVVITRGSLVVHANKADASQDAQGDKLLTLYGSPVTFMQVADDGEKIEGQANQFSYNTKSNMAILTGRARVKKGKNIVIGDTLTYNTQTQVYSATSGMANGVNKKSSGRITVILDQGQDGSSNTNKK